jgi:hypothetical protein
MENSEAQLMADIVKAGAKQHKEKFSVPVGTDILLFLKNLQHWAVENEHEEIRQAAHEVQESYKGLDKYMVENANLMLLVQRELDLTCEQVQADHNARTAAAHAHFRSDVWDHNGVKEYAAWDKAMQQKLEHMQTLSHWNITRYWEAWRRLFDKLDMVIR